VDVVELFGEIVVVLIEDDVRFPQPAIMSAVPRSTTRAGCLQILLIAQL